MRLTDIRGFELARLTDLVCRTSLVQIRLVTSCGQVAGQNWELFCDHLVLDKTKVPYHQIESYQLGVENIGFPFGQYLVMPSTEDGWSDWEQRCDLDAFVPHLVAGKYVRFSVYDSDGGTFVEGKIHSITHDHIVLAEGAICVERNKIRWICHRL